MSWSLVVHYQTWPTFAYANLQMKKSILPQRRIKSCWTKFEIWEDVVDGHSIIFRRKTVFDELFTRNSSNICKSFIGIDASQLYPYSMCQPMPIHLYTRWDLDPKTSRFTLRQNKPRSLEKKVMSYFQRTFCKIGSFYTTGWQKKVDCFRVDGFCSHCNTVFAAMCWFYHFYACQEVRPSVTEEEIQLSSKKRELDELRRSSMQEKGFTVREMWDWEGWRLYKASNDVKKHIRENFLYRCSMTADQLLQEIENGSFFLFVHCGIKLPALRTSFANFPPFFKNTMILVTQSKLTPRKKRKNNIST